MKRERENKKNLFNNIERQVHAKKNIVGALFIATLMLFVVFSSMLIFVPTATAAYTDYASHKLITINHTKVDGDLTNFPVWVHNISDDFKDTGHSGSILSNGSDIAFFSFDNNTQYNHEIETYNGTTGEIGIWVNVTSVTSASDTYFWIYYGDNDGGYGVNHNPRDVWDTDYGAVYHMDGTTWQTTTDSTEKNDIEGETGDPTYAQTGISGLAVDFDGTLDRLDCGDHADWDTMASQYTFEIWWKGTINVDVQYFLHREDKFILRWDGSEVIRTYSYMSDYCPGVTPLGNDSWRYGVGRKTGPTGPDNWTQIYYNKTLDFEIENSGASPPAAYHVFMGAHATDSNDGFDGILDEVRLSKVSRSRSYLNATYESISSPSTFLTFEAGDTSSSYSLKGLTSNRVTWAGTAGTTVWCNSSGDGNEWPEINMSINASDNVTELHVFMDDLNDTDAWINATNITMYVSSDNSSYGEMGTFTDGGSNCTNHINSTNWNAGTMGADPFADAGLTDGTFEIYIIFKYLVNYKFKDLNSQVNPKTF